METLDYIITTKAIWEGDNGTPYAPYIPLYTIMRCAFIIIVEGDAFYYQKDRSKVHGNTKYQIKDLQKHIEHLHSYKPETIDLYI